MPQSFREEEKQWLGQARNCFACGTENPASMGIHLYRVADRVYADYAVPARFRGLSKTTHGGIVCTLLDEVTVSGISYLLNETCVTAEMTVRFKKPVPIETPLRLCCWIVGREGRVVRGRGEIIGPDDQVLAEAETKAIALDKEKAKRFLAPDAIAKMEKP